MMMAAWSKGTRHRDQPLVSRTSPLWSWLLLAGALPRPDSFENADHERYLITASMMLAPKKPPVAAVLVNAEVTTRVMHSIVGLHWKPNTQTRDDSTMIATVGTTFPATLAIDWIPPRVTTRHQYQERQQTFHAEVPKEISAAPR